MAVFRVVLGFQNKPPWVAPKIEFWQTEEGIFSTCVSQPLLTREEKTRENDLWVSRHNKIHLAKTLPSLLAEPPPLDSNSSYIQPTMHCCRGLTLGTTGQCPCCVCPPPERERRGVWALQVHCCRNHFHI